MVAVGPVGGAWSQLANASFCLSALISDVLLIRICLVFGFLFLGANAMTGLPLAPDVFFSTGWPEHTIFVDLLTWAVVNICFHLMAISRHVQDELPVHFSEEEEAAWRFFYRRSGMARTEFKVTVSKAEWVNVAAGQMIVGTDQSLKFLHLVVEGLVECSASYNGVPSEPFVLHSGDLFDLEVANVFGIRIGFESDRFEALARSNCKLLRWSFQEVNAMANSAPALGAFWRNLLLYTVASELNRTHKGVADSPVDSQGEPEEPGWLRGERSRDFSRPLSDAEALPKNTLSSVAKWVWSSINPLPPPGLRHTAMPNSGVTSRNRLNAVVRCLEFGERLGSLSGQEALETSLETSSGVTDRRAVRRAASRIGSRHKPGTGADPMLPPLPQIGESDAVDATNDWSKLTRVSWLNGSRGNVVEPPPPLAEIELTHVHPSGAGAVNF
jgi:hypothetical protein